MATGRVPTTANSPLTAKGDLFGYSTAPARLAVGNDGEQIVADSSTATGLRYQGNYAAGKNKVLNGDFNIWQRGTSFATTGGPVPYTADRFVVQNSGSGGSITVSRQAFTVGQTDVPNNPTYFLRTAYTTQPTSGGTSDVIQRIEDVSTFASQTVAVSFYAKASSTFTISAILGQSFGSGGSGDVYTSLTLSSSSVGTSWARYTGTVTLPSISGKTVGAGNHLAFYVRVNTVTTGASWDLSNVQVEAGSVATSFQTATGTLQGELAACQRYYQRQVSDNVYLVGNVIPQNTTTVYGLIGLKTSMRITPTVLDVNVLRITDTNGASTPSGAWSIYAGGSGRETVCLTNSTFAGLAQFRPCFFELNGSSGYVGFGAEL
jgi:hypothetical protein